MATKKARPRKRPHLKRRISPEGEPRFVQITATSRPRSDGEAGGIDRLFALDVWGGVWQFDDDHSLWFKLAAKREPNTDPAYDAEHG